MATSTRVGAGMPGAPDAPDDSDGPDPLPAELRALLPRPSQDRARDTVRAVADAAVAILDESGDAGFSIDAVRRRSGVTTGSIYHHFGDVARLLAVARALRFRRSMASAIDVAVRRYADVTDAEMMAGTTRVQVVARDQPEARAAVWILSDALAASRDLPELAAAVSASFRAGTARLEQVFQGLQARGLIPKDVDPRTMLIVSRALSHARLLDDLDPRPVPHRDWIAVSCRLHDGLLDPRPLMPIVPTDPDRVAALRSAVALDGVVEDDAGELAGASEPGGDPRVTAMVAATRVLLVTAGPAAVQVGLLREEHGVSAGWFHRTFGDRDSLIDAARLDLLARSLSSELRSFRSLVDLARTPDEMVDVVADWMASPPGAVLSRRMRWQRMDLLSAARMRPGLGQEAGIVIGRASDRMAEVVVAAQGKGLFRPDLAPRAVARIVHAAVYGAILTELDGRPMDPAAVRHTIRRSLRQLTT